MAKKKQYHTVQMTFESLKDAQKALSAYSAIQPYGLPEYCEWQIKQGKTT